MVTSDGAVTPGREGLEGEGGDVADREGAPLSPRQEAERRLARWADVWTLALGAAAGPLPTLAELRAWRADCTEAIFSAALADVAASVAAGKARAPRALFRANVKTQIADVGAWTPAQVRDLVQPATPKIPTGPPEGCVWDDPLDPDYVAPEGETTAATPRSPDLKLGRDAFAKIFGELEAQISYGAKGVQP